MKSNDEYGFIAAALSGLNLFEVTQRASGRTSRMLERVTDDDQIVFSNEREKSRVERLLKKSGKMKVRLYVVDPKRVPMELVGTAPRGRTFFDHSWSREFLMHRIHQANHALGVFQRETSKTWPESPDALRNPVADFLNERMWIE